MNDNAFYLKSIDLNSTSPVFFTEKIITKEWKEFLASRKKSLAVRPAVLNSWQRCLEMQVDPYSGKSLEILPDHQFRKRLEFNRDLIAIVKPIMQQTYASIRNLGYILYFTDSDAYLLYVIGDKPVETAFKKDFNFIPGASWSEKAVGTTAVCMALAEACAIPFMSQEKFCLQLKQTACSGIPVRDIDGNMLGILGIAANFPHVDLRVFNILLAAQMAVENQLRMLGINKNLKVVNNYYKRIFNSVSDAIIAVDHQGIIRDINDRAIGILNDQPRNIIGRNVQDIIKFYPVLLNELKPCVANERGKATFLYDTAGGHFRYNVKNEIPLITEDDLSKTNVNILKISEKQARPSAGKEKECAPSTKYCFNDLIGKSPAFVAVKNMGIRAASSEANILITGKSGTGKEMMAQAIHSASPRRFYPFVAINCGSVPKELIESEFFGYDDGAFTGANKGGKMGKFEMACGGTVFLDEICEMPYDLQVRLLRVLQEKEITRIGGSRPIKVDVRIIAATNQDVDEAIANGKFRSDLYWRLNVVGIHIPELSLRADDILELSHHFIRNNIKIPGQDIQISSRVFRIFQNYSWPGNVRELKNIIERAMIFIDGDVLLPEHLPDYIFRKQAAPELPSGERSIPQVERNVIKEALDKNHWNISRCAKELNISRNTLYSKIKKYKIKCSGF